MKIKHIRIILTFLIALFVLTGNKKLEELSQANSPISLTTSDGSGLILKSYESNTVLDGFFAFTEIKLTFFNPEDRQREGRFRITLPDNAHLARFSMQIADRWQEGEVVEREKATRVYEDFLHRKQDPALLETDAGNEFSARIFPIPAKSEKKLILSYSSTLGGFPPRFTLPVIGLPEIEDFNLRVMFEDEEFKHEGSVSNANEDVKSVTRKVFSISKKMFKPKQNFIFEHKVKDNLITTNAKNFALKLVPFPIQKEKDVSFDQLVILVDTSASSSLHFKESVSKLETLLNKLDLKDSYIFGFDTGLSSYGKGDSGIKKLKEVEPLGSSNLSKSMFELGKIIGDQNFRLLIVSDSVLTAGKIDQKSIAESLKQQTWMERLDVLVPSAYKDKDIIETLVSAGKKSGISIPLESDLSEIQKRLYANVLPVPKVEIPDANWFYTDSSASIQPGDTITVFGEMKEPTTQNKINLMLDGKTIKNLKFVTTEPLLLDREVTAARINRLLSRAEIESNSDISKGLKLQAVNLSTSFRIQCPLTSFLVLETAEDYERFQITRNSLTDIMTMGVGGIEVINRKVLASYDFLNAENSELRRREKEERLRLLRERERESESRKEGAKDDSKKMESAPSVTSDAIRSEDNRNQPSTESSTDESIDTDVPPPPPKTAVENLESLPTRNSFQLKSQVPIRPRPEPVEKREKIDPYQGKLKEFYILFDAGENLKALSFARQWRESSPEDILALLAMGDVYFALGDRKNALRSYTSFVDYFPRRADIRRWAGEKLFSIGMYEDAIDTLSKALVERPDHPSTYHLLAIAYIKTSQWKKAYDVLISGLNQKFPTRFTSAHDILYDDLDLLHTILKNSDKEKILSTKENTSPVKLKILGPEIRFLLVWETDANDVDFHIYDKDNHHAFYSEKKLASGGELYADLTGGYGPECFRIVNPKAFPYRLEAHYYSRGPMGYGMGAMQVIRFDGDKKLDVETRSFVIMNDGAYVDLGKVK